jgi:hypothetical protein
MKVCGIAVFSQSMGHPQNIHHYTSIHLLHNNPDRFLLNGIADSVPLGVSKVSVLYSLAKQSRNLGAFKLARIACVRWCGSRPLPITHFTMLSLVHPLCRPVPTLAAFVSRLHWTFRW